MGAYLDLRDSLQRFLIDFSMKNMSDGKGTVFPTTSLKLNQTFYRTDQDKLYRLNVVNPASWVQEMADYFLFDFDAHATELQYPEHDIIGVRAYGLHTLDKQIEVSGMIGISIFLDSKLKKHHVVLDKLLSVLFPSMMIPVQNYTDNSGTKYDDMKIMNGTEVLPVVNTDMRVFQFIGITAGTGVTVKI